MECGGFCATKVLAVCVSVTKCLKTFHTYPVCSLREIERDWVREIERRDWEGLREIERVRETEIDWERLRLREIERGWEKGWERLREIERVRDWEWKRLREVEKEIEKEIERERLRERLREIEREREGREHLLTDILANLPTYCSHYISTHWYIRTFVLPTFCHGFLHPSLTH